MRILHVLDHSLPVQTGYSFRSQAILVEQRKRGWETVIVTGSKHGKFEKPVEESGGLPVYRTANSGSFMERLPVLDQMEVVRLLRARLREVIARERPDVIHAHSPCLNGLAARNLGVPLVYEMRSSWEDAAVSSGTTTEGSLRYRASRWLETQLLLRADGVTTICEGLRQDIVARGASPERVVVIPNAVDTKRFAPRQSERAKARAALGLGNELLLAFIGSFYAWEGLVFLVEALPRLPGTKLLLVGGGPDEAAIRSAIDRLGLRDRVILPGHVPQAAVRDFYDAADAMIYPRTPMRLTDMVTPLKPLEAMALAKVSICSDVGGHRELVQDGETGLLFRAGNAQSLAAAVGRLGEPGLIERLSANGRRFVCEQRTWESSVARYAPLYDQVLGRARLGVAA